MFKHTKAALPGKPLLDFCAVGAVGGILMKERHGLEFLTGLCSEILQEIEHQFAEVLIRRGGPEEILEPTLRERRLSGVCVDEGNSCALGGLARRSGHRGEVGSNERMDLLLCNETLGFALAYLRFALMINDDRRDLSSAQARQALVLGKRQRQVSALVDNFYGGPDRGYRVDPDLRGRAREWIEHANLDLLLRLR